MYILEKEMLEEYRRYLYQEEKSRATIEKYVRDIWCFYQYAGVDRPVTKETVILYKNYLLERYRASSANSMLIALNGFFRFFGWSGCGVKGIKVQRDMFRSEEKELTKKEYERLLYAAKKKDKRLYYLVQTICATGIRISELKFITIEGLKRGRIEVSCKGKCRRVFVPSGLRTELLRFVRKEGRKCGPVFVSKNGNAVNRSNVWAQMKKLCGAAKVLKEKVFPHNLRHLFANTFYERKKDLAKLADILGHSSIETTRIYTVTAGREHEREISALGLTVV